METQLAVCIPSTWRIPLHSHPPASQQPVRPLLWNSEAEEPHTHQVTSKNSTSMQLGHSSHLDLIIFWAHIHTAMLFSLSNIFKRYLDSSPVTDKGMERSAFQVHNYKVVGACGNDCTLMSARNHGYTPRVFLTPEPFWDLNWFPKLLGHECASHS